MRARHVPRAEVIVPNRNRIDLLRRSLASLRSQAYRDFRPVVVDNGSTDGSVEMVRGEFPECRVIALLENRGFAGAVNLGIRSSRSELIALLNNDAEAEPGWLAALVRALDAHPGFVIAASKIL